MRPQQLAHLTDYFVDIICGSEGEGVCVCVGCVCVCVCVCGCGWLGGYPHRLPSHTLSTYALTSTLPSPHLPINTHTHPHTHTTRAPTYMLTHAHTHMPTHKHMHTHKHTHTHKHMHTHAHTSHTHKEDSSRSRNIEIKPLGCPLLKCLPRTRTARINNGHASYFAEASCFLALQEGVIARENVASCV